MFKYNKVKIKVALEEEASRPQDHGSIRECTCTTHLWSNLYYHSVEFFIIHKESFIFFIEMDCTFLYFLIYQGHELRRLSAHDRLWASNSQNTTGRPQILSRSVREFVHPLSIASTRWSYLQPRIRIDIRVSRRIVPVSLLQSIVICFL